jgi:transposase
LCIKHSSAWEIDRSCSPQAIGGFRRFFLEPYEDAIKAQLSIHPSLTLKELQTWLAHEQGLSLCISAIAKFVRQKLGYRYKKTVFASEQRRADVAVAESTGKPGRKAVSCRSWFFSTKPVLRLIGSAAMAVR